MHPDALDGRVALICVDSACEPIEESGLLCSVVAETGHRSELGDELFGCAQFGLDVEVVELVEMGSEVLDELGAFLFGEIRQQRSNPVQIVSAVVGAWVVFIRFPPSRPTAGPSRR